MAGLTYSRSSSGGLDASDTLNIADIEMLQQAIRGYGNSPYYWLPWTMFDLNNRTGITQDDVTAWVTTADTDLAELH